MGPPFFHLAPKVLRPLFFLILAANAALAGNSATSNDGKWRAQIGPPNMLVIRAIADGQIAATFKAISRSGIPVGFEGVYVDPTRRQFITPLSGVAEYWLIATDPNAPPVYEGFVHSHETGMIEALPSSQGLFARRRVILEGGEPLGKLTFSTDFREMTGLTADGAWTVTINLYVNREIARQPKRP